MARYPGIRHRPDGIITLSSGAIIAVETERSLKTRARYITIINSHLAASDAGCWHYAMYVMPDEKTRVSLGRLFDRIASATCEVQNCADQCPARDVAGVRRNHPQRSGSDEQRATGSSRAIENEATALSHHRAGRPVQQAERAGLTDVGA